MTLSSRPITGPIRLFLLTLTSSPLPQGEEAFFIHPLPLGEGRGEGSSEKMLGGEFTSACTSGLPLYTPFSIAHCPLLLPVDADFKYSIVLQV